MDNMMLLLLVLPLGAFSSTYDYMGPPFVDINCTTDHEAKTHTINIFWKVDPPTNLNLTPAQISYRLADARADIDCDSTNRTVANDYSRTSDDISDKHQLSYEISTNYKYYESCEVLVFYDDFDDPSQNFSITTTVKECQLEVPSIVLSTPSNMTAHKGSTFKISFEYYAVPPPNYTWYINDEFYETVIGAKNNGIHTMVFTAIQEGWYRCVLENSFGTDVYAVFVNILGPTITEAPVNIADTLEGSVTFTCTATGIPLPNITWSSDNNDSIASTSNMTLGNITIQSNLTLSVLQRDDFMNYTCTAVNEFGIDSGTAVLGMIPKILQGPQSISELQGTDATFNCSASGIPPPTILWTFTNNDNEVTTLSSTRNYKDSENVMGELDLSGVTKDDFGTFSCVAVNIFDTDAEAATLVLKSRPTITEAPVNIADTLKGSVTFTCTATGIPLPNITWSSDNNDSIAATSNMTLGNITIQSNLTLSVLQRDDFMNYTCTAVNELGIDSGTAVLGMVPKILQGPQSISELQGTVANFNCSASGIPPPTILWTFTNNDNEVTALNSTRNNKDSENVMGGLDLLGVTKDNFGTYSCIAVNIFDTDAEAATLVLKSIVTNVTEPPAAVPVSTTLHPTATSVATVALLPTAFPSTSSVPPSNTNSSSQTIIIILSIATFIICFVIIVISLGVAVYRWRRKSYLSKDATKCMMPPVDNDYIIQT